MLVTNAGIGIHPAQEGAADAAANAVVPGGVGRRDLGETGLGHWRAPLRERFENAPKGPDGSKRSGCPLGAS
jgi:hypothetical protein